MYWAISLTNNDHQGKQLSRKLMHNVGRIMPPCSAAAVLGGRRGTRRCAAKRSTEAKRTPEGTDSGWGERVGLTAHRDSAGEQCEETGRETVPRNSVGETGRGNSDRNSAGEQ